MQRQVKNVMASVGCHGNSDVNKTWIITDFHIYTEQLWSHLNDIDYPDNSACTKWRSPRPTDVIVSLQIIQSKNIMLISQNNHTSLFSKQKKSNTIKITNAELATTGNIFFLIRIFRFQTEFSFQFVRVEYSDTFVGFRKLYYRVPFVRKTHLVLSHQATRKKRAMHDETKMAASETFLGFYMTSPKLKNRELSILLSFYFLC